MQSKMFAGLIIFVLSAAAHESQAAIVTVDFTVNPGSWVAYQGSSPFGLPTDPTLSGSLQLDNTVTSGASFVGLNYVTGSRTWTLGDIDRSASSAFFNGGDFTSFVLRFNSVKNYVFSGNTAQVNDEAGNAIYCDACVTARQVGGAVPEPTTWALSLFGLGVIGAMSRRRRLAKL